MSGAHGGAVVHVAVCILKPAAVGAAVDFLGAVGVVFIDANQPKAAS